MLFVTMTYHILDPMIKVTHMTENYMTLTS